MKKKPVVIKAASAQKQPEFNGMPEKPVLVLRAEEYCAALDEIDIKKENAEHRKLELVRQLKADSVVRVVCRDSNGAKRTFELETLEKLKVKKAKA
jgi:hypothetical protein